MNQNAGRDEAGPFVLLHAPTPPATELDIQEKTHGDHRPNKRKSECCGRSDMAFVAVVLLLSLRYGMVCRCRSSSRVWVNSTISEATFLFVISQINL